MISDYRYAIITGLAGSGKTTIGRWFTIDKKNEKSTVLHILNRVLRIPHIGIFNDHIYNEVKYRIWDFTVDIDDIEKVIPVKQFESADALIWMIDARDKEIIDESYYMYEKYREICGNIPVYIWLHKWDDFYNSLDKISDSDFISIDEIKETFNVPPSNIFTTSIFNIYDGKSLLERAISEITFNILSAKRRTKVQIKEIKEPTEIKIDEKSYSDIDIILSINIDEEINQLISGEFDTDNINTLIEGIVRSVSHFSINIFDDEIFTSILITCDDGERIIIKRPSIFKNILMFVIKNSKKNDEDIIKIVEKFMESEKHLLVE